MEFIAIDEGFIAKFECRNCYYSIKSRQLDKRTLKDNFYNLYKYCGLDDDIFRLFLRKGVYPYEHMDSFERFEETELPPIEAFYSELNLSEISMNDYKHAKKVYEVMECRDWVITMISTYAAMSCFWLMSLRTFGIHVSVYMA